jgi:biopolymer transport protein ExbD
MRMTRFAAAAEPQPFSQMNITPLIDVMLVLLVMLLLSIPMATHKVPVDLPGTGGPAAEWERHRMRIDANGAVTLNGAALSDAALRARLAQIAATPDALLELETDPAARYARFDELLADIRRAGVTRLGFIGNERYRRW